MKHFLLSSFILISTSVLGQNVHWGNVINNSYNDYIYDLEADKDFNLIITGLFSGSVDFDPGPGIAILNTGNMSNSDIFIAKYDSAGNYLWAHRFGSGFIYDESDRVAIDSAGNIFITGMFGGTVDFDPDTINTANISAAGSNRARFLAKYDASGNFIAVQHVGAAVGNLPSSQDGQSGLDCDADGNVYMSGFYGTSLTLGPGITLGVSGLSDIYFAKYDPLLNINWGYRVGSNETEYSQGLVVHPSGKLILLGSFRNTVDFDPGPGVANLTQVSSTQDGFFACYDSAGQFNFVKQYEAGTSASPIATLIDRDLNIIVTGSCAGTMDADPGPGVVTVGTGFNDQAFIAMYDSIGNYRWAHAYGDVNTYNAIRYAGIDTSGNIFVAGNYSPFVDIDPGPDTAAFGNRFGSYVASYDTSGEFRSAFFIQEVHMWLHKQDIFLGGGFYGLVDFDPGPQSYTLMSDTANASWYLLRMHVCDNFATSTGTISVPPACAGDTITFTVNQGGPLYAWEYSSGLIPIGPLNGNTLSVIIDTAAVQETIVVYSVDGCQNSPMVFTTVFVNHATIPLITQLNDSLVTSTTALTYQWFLNDTLLIGAIDSIYVPLVSGVYTLMISDSNGCSAISAPINFVMSGENEILKSNIFLYPNPFKEHLDVLVSDRAEGAVMLVSDVMGRVVFKEVINRSKFIIPTSGWIPGIYNVTINNENLHWSGRVMRE